MWNVNICIMIRIFALQFWDLKFNWNYSGWHFLGCEQSSDCESNITIAVVRFCNPFKLNCKSAVGLFLMNSKRQFNSIALVIIYKGFVCKSLHIFEHDFTEYTVSLKVGKKTTTFSSNTEKSLRLFTIVLIEFLWCDVCFFFSLFVVNSVLV